VRNDNYPSASEMIRNLGDIKVPHEVFESTGKFRIVRFAAPFFQGSEFWVVSEKGFMWEPADSVEAAKE
jgi:hypothetical protein